MDLSRKLHLTFDKLRQKNTAINNIEDHFEQQKPCESSKITANISSKCTLTRDAMIHLNHILHTDMKIMISIQYISSQEIDLYFGFAKKKKYSRELQHLSLFTCA